MLFDIYFNFNLRKTKQPQQSLKLYLGNDKAGASVDKSLSNINTYLLYKGPWNNFVGKYQHV